MPTTSVAAAECITLHVVRRPLDEREHELLVHMIGFADPRDRAALLHQADAAVVTGLCGCGCPSVDLEVDRSAAQPIKGRRIIVDAYWSPADASGGGVLLFIIEGWLSDLEVWWVGQEPPAQLPPPADVIPPKQAT